MMKFPLGEYPVGNVIRVHCAAERQDEDGASTSLTQGLRTNIHRGTGRQDVVDQ